MRGSGQGRGCGASALTVGSAISISPPLRRISAGAPSSNGKTTDSDSVNRGSNPRGASISSGEHLAAMPDAPASPVQMPSFSVEAAEHGEGFRIEVRADGVHRAYVVPTGSQQDFSDFYRELAADFGTRMPEIFGDE